MILKKLLKFFRVTFLNECDKCDRKLKKTHYDNWYTFECKCGNKGFGHNLTDREL